MCASAATSFKFACTAAQFASKKIGREHCINSESDCLNNVPLLFDPEFFTSVKI